MLKNIKETVIAPLSTRLGTLLAGVLAPFGVNSDWAHMLAIGIIGACLIAGDLVLAQLRKRKLIGDVQTGKLV